jgi:ubiquinol-cytochrome c reductase cytochrome c subunit
MNSTGRFTLVAVAALLASAQSWAAQAQDEVQRGYETYLRVGCWQCHGTVGQGGGNAGPRLAPNPLPAATLLAIVRRPVKEMPPYYPRVLSDSDVFAIRAYLASIGPPPAPNDLVQLRTGSR